MGICHQLLARKHLAAKAALAIALAAVSFSASATRQMDAVVQPLSTTVSYSSPLGTNRIGYTVTISNVGSSNVNNVRYEGTLRIPASGSAPGLLAVWNRAEGDRAATCQAAGVTTASGPAVKVTCLLGTFTSGSGATLALYFDSPQSPDSADRIAFFDSFTYYAEGTTDSGSPPNDTVITDVDQVSLGTSLPNEVRSALTPAADSFSTQPGDELNTKLSVPEQANRYSSVSIKESRSNDSRTCKSQRNFERCFGTEVLVPGVVFLDSNFLTFELFASSFNLRRTARVDRVVIRYESDPVPELGIPAINVPDLHFCARVNGLAVPNNNYVPCIDVREQVPGGFRWIIINKKNGRFDLF
jgi:hypothetical protein